jgi:hypothetical protein
MILRKKEIQSLCCLNLFNASICMCCSQAPDDNFSKTPYHASRTPDGGQPACCCRILLLLRPARGHGMPTKMFVPLPIVEKA